MAARAAALQNAGRIPRARGSNGIVNQKVLLRNDKGIPLNSKERFEAIRPFGLDVFGSAPELWGLLRLGVMTFDVSCQQHKLVECAVVGKVSACLRLPSGGAHLPSRIHTPHMPRGESTDVRCPSLRPCRLMDEASRPRRATQLLD